MRLISIERLIKLVQIKEKSDDPTTLKQIRQLLEPFEYTKIDRIIDVIFTTAADVESHEELTNLSTTPTGEQAIENYTQDRTDPALINAKRQDAVESFARMKGKVLVKNSRTLFWSADKDLRVCCAVSKRYDGDYQPYWYAFHPKWDDFLNGGSEGFLLLTCMDRNEAYAVPYSWLVDNKQNLNITERGERSYWHIALTTLPDGALAINVSKKGIKVPLRPFAFDIER